MLTLKHQLNLKNIEIWNIKDDRRMPYSRYANNCLIIGWNCCSWALYTAEVWYGITWPHIRLADPDNNEIYASKAADWSCRVKIKELINCNEDMYHANLICSCSYWYAQKCGSDATESGGTAEVGLTWQVPSPGKFCSNLLSLSLQLWVSGST